MVGEDTAEASSRDADFESTTPTQNTMQHGAEREPEGVSRGEGEQGAAAPSDPGTSQQAGAEGAEGGDVEPSESMEEGVSQRGGSGKRSEELLLKNRKAQRRFRERQKSRITELEGKNSELTVEMKRIQQNNLALEGRVNALLQLVHNRNTQIEQLRSSQQAGWEESTFTDSLVLTWSEGQTFALTPDQVKQMTREDLVKVWKEYVKQMASYLGEYDSQNPSTGPAAVEAITRLTNELTVLLLRVSICSPMVAKSFAAYQLEDTRLVPEEENPELWRSIMSTLALSNEQRTELIQLRRLYLNKQADIMDQRKEICNAFMDALPSSIGERHTSTQYMKAHDASELMKQNLKEEHALKLDWVSTVFKHMLTPIQLARCLVQSYPWYPDSLAMCTWLAAEAGDPAAMASFTPSNLSQRGSGIMSLPSSPFGLSLPRASSGYSTPRGNTTPTTPPRTTAAPTPFQMGAPMSPGVGRRYSAPLQIQTQHHHLQYGHSPMSSPHYTPHGTPSPQPSPPVSPSQVLSNTFLHPPGPSHQGPHQGYDRP